MKQFNARGVEIRYRVEGERGPLIVLLHGFGGGPQDWKELWPVLSHHYRIVIPNIKSFFSHEQPLTFSGQIDVLVDFLQELQRRKKVSDFSVIGQSYGATLSLGLALRPEMNVTQHLMLNPMPFYPLKKVRDPHLQILINFSYTPAAVGHFLRTPTGQRSLLEAGRIFRIGTDGQHETQHFNHRKLLLIEKAVERFRWIDQNEKWAIWEERLMSSPQFQHNRPNRHICYSTHDPLFFIKDYEAFASQVGAQSSVPIDHMGHLLLQDRGSDIINIWPFSKH